MEGKIHWWPFSISETKKTRPWKVVHADTRGPVEVLPIQVVPDISSLWKFITQITDLCILLKGRNKWKECTENFINKATNITNNKIHFFRSGNVLELVKKEARDLFSTHGIIQQTIRNTRSKQNTPEKNGKTEYENWTWVEAARTMCVQKAYWRSYGGSYSNCSIYVLNRTRKNNDVRKTPCETWTNKHFDKWIKNH